MQFSLQAVSPGTFECSRGQSINGGPAAGGLVEELTTPRLIKYSLLRNVTQDLGLGLIWLRVGTNGRPL